MDTFTSLAHAHNAIFSTFIFLEKKFTLMVFNNAFNLQMQDTRALLKDSTTLNLEDMRGSLFDNSHQFYLFKKHQEI